MQRLPSMKVRQVHARRRLSFFSRNVTATEPTMSKSPPMALFT